MSKTAVIWIRDGVLIDRMHINPVAFAVASWIFSAPKNRGETCVEDLINFGFEKSGVSCAEKMHMYNKERHELIEEVERASDLYNILASKAAAGARYFTGAVDLLKDLQASGAENFISSAVNQSVLDIWMQEQQGQSVAPYLKEILGQRPDFTKGRDHFDYISKNNKSIYYVADAISEIRAGKLYSHEYNIYPIGFGNVIEIEDVLKAVELVSQALAECAAGSVKDSEPLTKMVVDGAKIQLPTGRKIESELCEAGAASVITGNKVAMMQDLRNLFKKLSVLAPN